MQVHFEVFGLRRCVSAVPGSGVNKEPILEDEEVRISRIALGHAEPVHLLPLARILARQDDHRCVGTHPVAVRAIPKREVQRPLELRQVRERIVAAIVENLADVADVDFRRLSKRDLRHDHEHRQDEDLH